MTRSALVLLFVAFAAGGAFGWLAGRSFAPAAPAGSPTARGEEAGRPAARPDALVAPEIRPVAAAVGSPSASSPAPAPSGDGRIEGVVKDAAGRPVAGVVIRAYWQDREQQYRWRRGDVPPEEDDLEEAMREFAENFRRRRAGRRNAVSGPDGTFVIDGTGDGEWRLQAYREGFEIQATSRMPVRTGDHVEFQAVELATIPLRVLDAGGAPSEYATIECRSSSMGTSSSWSPDRPYIRLEPGTWRLRALGGPDQLVRSEYVDVTAAAGRHAEEVVLQLVEKPGIRGAVVFEEPEEWSYLQVALFRGGSGAAAPRPEDLRRAEQRTTIHQSQNGYVFHDVEPGEWLVAAFDQGQAPVASAAVVVGDGMVTADLVVKPPAREEYVLVTATGPDGGAVADVSFSVDSSWANSRRAGGARSSRDPGGGYRVFIPAGDDMPADAQHTLRAQSRSFGQKSAPLPAGGGTLSIRFEEPAFLEVVVTGAPERADLRVSLQERQEGGRMYGFGGEEVTGSGPVKLGPVSPGDYQLVLVLDRYSILDRPITLGSGRRQETLAAPPLYETTVVVPDAATPTSVILSGRGEQGRFGSRHANSANGRAVFTNLPAGEYSVRVSGRSGTMEIQVPGASEIVFQAVERNAQLVRVRDASGALAKAGLRDGDVIIGVDGVRFEDEQQIRAAWVLARGRDKLTLLVIRGGKTLEITAPNPADWYAGGDAGGSLEPIAR